MNKIAHPMFLMLATVILLSIIIVYFTNVATAQMIEQPINSSLDGSNEDYLQTIQYINNSLEIKGFLPYVNFDMGLKIKYPSDWSPPIERREFSDIAFQDIDTISFILRAENNAKNFTNYFNVFVSKSEKNFTDKFPTVVKLSRYKTNGNASLAEIVDQRINYYKNTIWLYPDFHLINSNSTDASIWLSHMLNFSYVGPDFETIINNTEVITLQNDNVYSISYSAQEEEYSKYLPAIVEMINSLEIFDTLQYEKVFNNNSGVILQYPDQYPWKPTEIDGHNINLMEENPYFMQDFTLSIYPYQKPLVNLTNELISQYKKNIPSFESIENNTAEEISTIDESKTAHKIIFVYYDKHINENVKAIQVYTIIDNNAYIFTYNPDPIFYNDFLPIIQKVNYLPFIEEVVDSVKIMEFLPFPKKDKFAYYNSAYGLRINQPLDWPVQDHGANVQILPPPKQNYSFNFQIITRPSANLKFSELVQRDILSDIELNNNNVFEFIRSNISITKDAQQIYEIEYKIGDSNTLSNYILHNNGNYYVILYSADTFDYYYYLPIVKEMIESFEVNQSRKARLLTGLNVGKGPAGIAVNPNTDMVYVVNSISDTVSVRNGSNNDIITEIEVGKGPAGIAVNPTTDIIYVSNLDSDSVSVIDGSKNTKIKDISVGPNPLSIAVNQFTSKIYVADSSSRNVYVIDGLNNDITQTIQTGGGIDVDLGIGITLNQFTNRIYVANPTTNNITVIDGHTNRIIINISIPSDYRDGNIDPLPNEIAVDPFTNIAYVIHSSYDAISAIDLSNNAKLGHTRFFNGSLNSLAVNPFINKIYATDYSFDAIYVIEPSSFIAPSDKDNHIKSIKVDSLPLHVAVNPNTNTVYVTNSRSDSFTIINGTDNKIIFRVNFHFLSSLDSKSVFCNGRQIHNNDQIWYKDGTIVKCSVEQKNILNPIVATFWKGLESISPGAFIVDRHGTLEGEFLDLSGIIDNLAHLIAEIQRTGFYVSVIILISVIGMASAPFIVSKIRTDMDSLIKEDTKTTLLSKTEILGIDTSIIVGVLIFLSLSEGFAEGEQVQISVITANIVFPFAISVIIAINNHERFATRLTIAGFINLMISVILIAIMKI